MRRILSAFLISALLITVCFGAELQSYIKYKFLGINPRINPKLLLDDEATDSSNITLEESGSIQERPVFGQYNVSSGAIGSNSITGLFKFYATNAKYFVV